MISKESIFYLADKILEEFEKEKIQMKNRKAARSTIIKGMTEEMKFFESIDREVKEKISRMKKKVVEGTGEWIALYERFFNDEFRKRTGL